jgi:hypothetical protein
LSWGVDGFVNTSYNANGTPVRISEKLDCVGANGLYYEDTLIGALSGDFVAKFKYTPHYTTAPPNNVNIFSISQVSGTNDDIVIFNSPSGNNIRITANGLSAVTFDTWEPTAEQEYTFEIICISNQIFVYIDNLQIGTAKTISPSQGAASNRVWLGAYTGVYNIADGAFDNFILYSTASQTPTYTVPESKYSETSVILPEMEHTGDGTIKLFNSLSTIENGTPRILLEIGRSGNKLYWNGSAWVVSDETYAQATGLTVFNTNCSTLPVNGEKYGQFTIIFPDSNTVNSISELTANLNVDIGYLTTNPTISPYTGFRTDGLEDWVETVTKTGDDNIKRMIKLNSDYYYLLDGEWTIGSLLYVNSMTISEILAEKESLLTEGYGKTFIPITFLHSDDGTTTPYLDTDIITYNFSGNSPSLLEFIIWGYVRNIAQPKPGQPIKVKSKSYIGDKTIINDEEYEYTTLANGYFEITLIVEENNLPNYLEWNIAGELYRTQFPTEEITAFGELTHV